MNDFVLVEFISNSSEDHLLLSKLADLEEAGEYEVINDTIVNSTRHTYGKISSTCASFIKLRDPFLAERMRISFIPNELKDKFRK